MTKEREALKLALEAIKELRYSSSTFKFDKLSAEAITAIKEALAQPGMRPDEISTDELIYMNGLYDGMKQERALWELSKLGQEIEAQPEQDRKCRLCGEDQPFTGTCGGGKENPTALCFIPPQRPWVGLTDEEINAAAACQSWKPFAQAIETKLKEKNT